MLSPDVSEGWWAEVLHRALLFVQILAKIATRSRCTRRHPKVAIDALYINQFVDVLVSFQIKRQFVAPIRPLALCKPQKAQDSTPFAWFHLKGILF